MQKGPLKKKFKRAKRQKKQKNLSRPQGQHEIYNVLKENVEKANNATPYLEE